MICKESEKEIPDNAIIVRISATILTSYPHIIDTEIRTPYKIIYPLSKWKVTKNKVSGIPWWNAYNNIKHNRRKHFSDANLKNCIEALSSLFIAELYLSQIVLGKLDAITPINCDYFDCKYGLDYLEINAGSELPDF